MSANKSEEHPVQLVDLPQENTNEPRKPDGSSSLVTESPELPQVDPRYQKHCVTATIFTARQHSLLC